ncbi:MAG: hypothetical protein JEZ04_16510 [Spirochaetales bacterium]|nr:hypothetical protein [Spirochaetales bacterium]
MEKDWSKLDNAGKIYPGNINVRNTTLFRYVVTTKDIVIPELLQQAVDEIMPRFPYFQVHLKMGLFWYYFKKVSNRVVISEDIHYPCTKYDFKKNQFMFSVKYSRYLIAVEFSHAITDGFGAIEFMKSMLLRYFSLNNLDVSDTSGIKIPGQPINPDEYSDGFKEFYNVHSPASIRRNQRAFHLNFKLAPKGIYHVTTGMVNFEDIRKLSKEKKLNITALICVIYLEVFQQIIYEQKAKPAPIILNLPVNLRGIFGSETMYNFFVSITPAIDPRIGFFSEEDIIKHVQNYLNIELDRRFVGKMIKRNINLERNIFVRVMPLILKVSIMPILYNLWGERGYTSGISNLGKLEFPPEIEERIESVNIIPPPSPGNLVKMICFSFKDKFYFTFGSLTENKTVERLFFQRIRKLGIPVKIKTIPEIKR